MVSVGLADWAQQHGLLLEFIKPGRPMQTGFIERFNRSYREAPLDMFVFSEVAVAKFVASSGSAKPLFYSWRKK